MVAVDLLEVSGRGHLVGMGVSVLGGVSVSGLAVGHDVRERQSLRAGTQLFLQSLLPLDLLSAKKMTVIKVSTIQRCVFIGK